MRQSIFALNFSAVCAMLTACASANSIPIANDMVQITSSAAPVCGQLGAQRVAFQRAAVETIRRGFDKFLIVDGKYANNVRVIGHTPIQTHTTGSATATSFGNHIVANGSSYSYTTGGQPIIGGRHNQGFIVKMFKNGDPKGSKALAARSELGPKWKEAVEQDSVTCM